MRTITRFRTMLRSAAALIICLVTLISGTRIAYAKLPQSDLDAIYNNTVNYVAIDDAAGNSCTASGDGVVNNLTVGAKVFYIGDSLTYHMVQGNKANDASGQLLQQTGAEGYSTSTDYKGIGLDTNAPRVSGVSVEAQGGIGVASTIPHLTEHKQDWGDVINPTDATKNTYGADIIVIGLGTNLENDFTSQITNLMLTIRTSNKHAVIYWVNTYFSVQKTKYQEVNQAIQAASSTSDFHVIDYASAAAADPTIAPEPYATDSNGKVIHDGVHVETTAGRVKKAGWIVSQLPAIGSTVSATTSATSSPASSYDPTGLAYPAFPDEGQLATNIESYIRSSAPTSPWFKIPSVGSWILSESKSRGINPMIVMASGKTENNYGTSGNNASINNFFGMKGGDGNYIKFDTPQAGMDAFMDAIKRNTIDKTNPNYKDVTNMYEYFSVHQTGGIHYPGDGMHLVDPKMPNVVVSWETNYNPGVYWKTAAGVISAVTGVTISPEIPPKGGVVIGGCGGASTGVASQYISDCGANDGNAAITCTAINQLVGVSYSQSLRAAATDPNPKFLDCSAFTNMAIYRTFGVDLKGLCTQGYRTNPNFQDIADLSTIKPGDFVGTGTMCGTNDQGATGHIALVVSYDAAKKKLVTVEASSPKYLSGLRGVPGSYNVGIKPDGGNFTWAVRYIGPKILQPGAL